VLEPALHSIANPATLFSYGLPDVEWDSTAEQVTAAKAAYLSSYRFTAQDFGGELELCLAAHHFKGALAFLLLDSRASSPHTKVLCSAEFPFDSAASTSSGTRLVCLHHCSFAGQLDTVPAEATAARQPSQPTTSTSSTSPLQRECRCAPSSRTVSGRYSLGCTHWRKRRMSELPHSLQRSALPTKRCCLPRYVLSNSSTSTRETRKRCRLRHSCSKPSGNTTVRPARVALPEVREHRTLQH
jgi:hypothetical protein